MIGLQGTSSAQSVIPTAYAMPQSVVLPIADTALLTARTLARYHFPEDEREQLKAAVHSAKGYLQRSDQLQVRSVSGKRRSTGSIHDTWKRSGRAAGKASKAGYAAGKLYG